MKKFFTCTKDNSYLIYIGVPVSALIFNHFLLWDKNTVLLINLGSMQVAKEEHYDIRALSLHRLNQYGVNILTNTKVKSLSKGTVTVEQNGVEQTLEGLDSIILAVGAKSYNPLEKPLTDSGKKVHVIGDAKKAGNITDAIYEGANLGVSIQSLIDIYWSEPEVNGVNLKLKLCADIQPHVCM